MSYLLKNRSNKKGSFFRVFFFVVLMVIVLNSFFSNGLSSMTRTVISPLWKLKEVLFRSDSLEASVRSERSLVAENERLEQEIARLRLDILRQEEIEKENNKLKEALGALAGRRAIYASIIARPPISLYDTFVISHEKNAVKVGEKVVVYGSVPVGEIAEAGDTTSLVRLYSAPGNKFGVRLGGSEETVELSGVGGGNFKVRLPKSMPVSVSDKIFLPGTNDVLGIVEAVEERPSDSFKTVFVRSPVNIFKLTSVEILI